MFLDVYLIACYNYSIKGSGSMGLEVINTLKKSKGLTNEELSVLSGVPKGTIDKITAGTTKDPKLGTLKAIARVLGCSLNDFDNIKESPAPTKAEAGEDTAKAQLLKNYEALNKEGQTRLCDYSDDLVSSEKYTKNNQSEVCENA